MDEILKKALEIARKDYKAEEIIDILKKEDDFEKPVAILNLDIIKNQDEADLIIKHLTGCDGRIREACAYKISELLQNSNYCNYFLNNFSAETILNGIMDINPNVSRILIEGIRQCREFQMLICPFLINKTEDIIKQLKEFSNTSFVQNKLSNKRNHAKNKIVFNLYWLLETLYYIYFCENFKVRIENILNFTSSFADYTIREKSAKILSKINNPPCELLQKLKNDENFYVKNQLL